MDYAVLRDSHDARSRESAAPRDGSWPLLAELPRIEVEAELPKLRRFPADEAATPPSRSTDERAPRTNRYVVDARHVQRHVAPTAQPEHAAAEAVAERNASDRSRSAAHQRSPRLRVDPPAGHRPAAHARTPTEPPTFSAQMFRLHESLAPHLGLIGAAALMIAGSLLYWMAFAGSGMTIRPSELLEISTDWSLDSAPHTAPPAAVPESPAATEESAQAAGWTAPPRVASAPSTVSESPAAKPYANEGTPAPVLVPPGEAPVPLPPVDEHTPTTAMNVRGVTPRPTPTGMHPTTPYSADLLPTGIDTAAMPRPGMAHGPGPAGSVVNLPR